MANPETERKSIFTGARARLIYGGKRIGWATGVSGSREYTKEGVEVLDNVEVEEFATLGYRVSLRCSVVGLVETSLSEAGIMPEIGQSNEEHLANVLAMTPVTMQILDVKTGDVVREFYDCEASGESFNLQARSLMMTDVTFVTKRVADTGEV